MILRAVEAGSGPPVVLLHGLFGQAANFGTVQRMLAGKHRVVALDLRNHGQSPHAPDMSYPVMADDVLETLRHLSVLPCGIVGHSMGGKVAMTAALLAPDAVTRLLVSDIAPVRYPPSFRAYADAMAAIPLEAGLTRARADAALAPVVEAPSVRAFLLQNLRFTPTPEWRIDLPAITAALPAIEDWPAPAATYDGPTLFVAGARSDYIRPEHRPIIRALFPAARFITVKESGHWVHAENPSGFAAVVEAFLAAA